MSIEIKNFNIDLEEIREASTDFEISVDLVDYTNTVTYSGTYLEINGNRVTECYFDNLDVPYDDTLVSGTYTTISGGYNIKYRFVPDINFNVIAVGSNIFSTLSGSYGFEFGYSADYNKVKFYSNDYVVPLGIDVYNKSIDNNEVAFSTFFKTRSKKSSFFSANIIMYGSGYKDLYTTIEPQSMYFMYGKTYNITISGIKDFSGNILNPFTYNFTIENKI